MKVKTLVDIPSAKGVIPAGEIIDITPGVMEKLQGKVEPLSEATDGRDLPHWCQPGGCWCSEKLPGSDYPAGCVRLGCEHHLIDVDILNVE